MITENELSYVNAWKTSLVLQWLIVFSTLTLVSLVIKFHVHEIQVNKVNLDVQLNIIFILDFHECEQCRRLENCTDGQAMFTDLYRNYNLWNLPSSC